MYIDLYSDKGYREKFDNDIINNIISVYGEEKCRYDEKSRTIFISRK